MTNEKANGEEIEKSENDSNSKMSLKNGNLYFLQRSEGLQRIANSLKLDVETSDEVYKLCRLITDSPEAKALGDSINKIIQREGKNGEDGQKSITFDHPEMLRLMEIDSGLAVERITVSRSQVELSVNDRLTLEWLFDFTD